MKRSIYVRFSLTFLLVFAMLSPAAVLAAGPGGNGKKHFSEGVKHEDAEAWDKAAEEFALAVTEDPKNPEYRLHLTRALFNASQMYMKKGTIAAKEKDYATAYAAFRRSYAYDPTNELAKSEMDRMVRLQQDSVDPKSNDKKDDGKVKMVQTAYTGQPSGAQLPQRLEKLRDVPFPNGIDLQFLIKELAKDLDLNVLFDSTSFRPGGQTRKVNIELKNVTAAKALDYLFLQENLFFQKVGPRTIMVANADQRARFQQLVLRTFYLANAAPKDIVKVVQTAIPAQPGRSQTIVLTDDATNSVTVRDTEENIRLIGKLIASLDKDRAEVVMDVAIYEVNKTDLLQFGNQVGSQDQLTNFGLSSPVAVRFGDNPLKSVATAAATSALLPTSAVTGIVLPAMNLSAFQSKNNTKLIASTQIHAFNNEDSSAVIGQRVPVQSASFLGVGNTGGVNTGGNGVVSNVINYEQVGLTMKFKPLVFPNQDVQVYMEVESKDVSGASTLTPTFTQRTIKGTARVQNNKTLLLASVAQGVESKGKQGLPLLGLIPILGRLFTAPTRDNRQVDIVIAVTPRVIRAPSILPEDEVERPTGSQMSPTNNSLEAMMVQEERDEMLAAARRVPNATQVQLPDRQAENDPGYVKSGDATATNAAAAPDNTGTATNTVAGNTTAGNSTGTAAGVPDNTVAAKTAAPDSTVKPIDNSVRTLQLTQTADNSKGIDLSTQLVPVSTNPSSAETAKPAGTETVPTADITFGKELSEMKAGEKVKIPVMVQGSGVFRSATLGLKFDSKQMAVRSITFGDVFSPTIANTVATPFVDQDGKMFFTVEAKDGSAVNPIGILAYVEIEALVPGKPKLEFERDILNVVSPEGKSFKLLAQK